MTGDDSLDTDRQRIVRAYGHSSTKNEGVWSRESMNCLLYGVKERGLLISLLVGFIWLD